MTQNIEAASLLGVSTDGSIVENVIGMLDGVTIPASIKKNCLKALNQLCTAAINIPTAKLEGKAEEIHAESRARVGIITAAGKRIEEEMQLPSGYAQVAGEKFAKKIIREQVNLDNICKVAIVDIQESASLKNETEARIDSINEDWINHFQKEASLKSTEEMQLLFGRILAAEIQRPGSFSIKTINLLSSLDQTTAQLFVNLCSLSLSTRVNGVIYDARVLSFEGNAATNALEDFELNFLQLTILQEHGLIIADYNSWCRYNTSVVSDNNTVEVPYTYANQMWGFKPIRENKDIRLNGVRFSKSGLELLPIIDIQVNEEYTKKMENFIENQGFAIVPVKSDR